MDEHIPTVRVPAMPSDRAPVQRRDFLRLARQPAPVFAASSGAAQSKDYRAAAVLY
jgi:hypothetical protein